MAATHDEGRSWTHEAATEDAQVFEDLACASMPVVGGHLAPSALTPAKMHLHARSHLD
jgi:hypothetical protein